MTNSKEHYNRRRNFKGNQYTNDNNSFNYKKSLHEELKHKDQANLSNIAEKNGTIKSDVKLHKDNEKNHQELTSVEDDVITYYEYNENNDTEKLEQLDLSHIAETRIDKVKRNNKKEKEKEIRNQKDREM